MKNWREPCRVTQSEHRCEGHLLDEGNVAILIETHSDQLEADCRAWLLERNYKTSIIKNAWWRRILPDGRVIAHNRWLSASGRRPLKDHSSRSFICVISRARLPIWQ
jgi:hypothetical protein